tara:strand:- start:1417 stop:1824 length:408 start_codon:yes stop_codon:yes gene_type:complete
MPNGIYKSSIAQSCATGNANTPSVIFSAQIPGSSVDLANAFALHAELIAYSSGGPLTASVDVKLNGVLVGTFPVAQTGTTIDLTFWRTGNTQADVSGAANLALNGLSWAAGQAVEIIGVSNQVGGCIVQRAGVQR